MCTMKKKRKGSMQRKTFVKMGCVFKIGCSFSLFLMKIGTNFVAIRLVQFYDRRNNMNYPSALLNGRFRQKPKKNNADFQQSTKVTPSQLSNPTTDRRIPVQMLSDCPSPGGKCNKRMYDLLLLSI